MAGTFDDEIVHDWLACVADNPWISLHYESPAFSTVNRGEISGGGYVRRKAVFSTPTSRSMWTLHDVRFAGLTQNRLSHFGIWNAKNKGRMLAYGELPDEAIIVNGGGYIFLEGKIALSVD